MRALVCGAGGFIGGHLVRRLVGEGSWVRGVDHVPRRYGESEAHEYLLADLRQPEECARVLAGGFDEVYQLAADMGGMQFITSAECDIMHNNVLINSHMIAAVAHADVGRYFFASSVCVYRNMLIGEPEVDEDGVYPARPDNEYGWEKLFSERVTQAYGRRQGLATRIGRFENCYGPEGPWQGGREKAPAALCRKVAEAAPGGTIDVIGGGSTVRSFVFIDDLVEAVVTLMRSDETRPTNIGVDEQVTIRELVALVSRVAGKDVVVRPVDGPLGVESRNFSHARIGSLGWRPRHSLQDGIETTYEWIADQIHHSGRGALGDGSPGVQAP